MLVALDIYKGRFTAGKNDCIVGSVLSPRQNAAAPSRYVNQID
jgi:hypothetical protein